MEGLNAQAQAVSLPFQETVDALLEVYASAPSDTLLCRLYDWQLRFRNASIDREITLRQKLRYADRETLRLFRARDSLVLRLGRAYETPEHQEASVGALEQRITELENLMLQRVQRNDDYFKSLSVQFAREVYRNDPTLGNLGCRTRIALQGGSVKLADRLYRYALKKERNTWHWQQVRQELTESEAAVEFVTYHNGAAKQMHYGALVLRRQYTAPRFVPLCTRQALDAALRNEGIEDAFYLEQLYTPAPESSESSLYALLWAPIEPLLQGARRIYYAPAGDLHRLNVAAFSGNSGNQALLDRYEWVRINSTRSLINPFGEAANQLAGLPDIKMPCLSGKMISSTLTARFFGHVSAEHYDADLYDRKPTAALFGNILYDMDSLAIRNPDKKSPAPASPAGASPRNRQFRRGADWEFLYGAKTEIDNIQAILKQARYQVSAFEGYAASEEAFKQLGSGDKSPRILHIATHGFFLADSGAADHSARMHRSGLILAGANYAWKKGRPLHGMEDGILSAFEIESLNLQHTELVVLSACETGLGYIVNNEGVFGLQRAFKQAGVKNLVVSLWSIPDKATQLLMTQFYRNCLEQDMPIRKALNAAQQWMRAQEAYRNPYYWAGFVLLE